MSTSESTKKTTFVLGSRRSPLALAQTDLVKEALQKLYPDYSFPIVKMETAGDLNQTQALSTLATLPGGKGLWTEDLEAKLIRDEIDIVVHSLKDIPTVLAPEFELAAVMDRASPFDALIVKKGSPYKSLGDLPDGAVVGTSSIRRVAQLSRNFPKLKFRDLRGNLGTRFRKLDEPESFADQPAYADLTVNPLDAMILAQAGLDRLDLSARSTSLITPPELYYAVGQGALGIEIRSNDSVTREILSDVCHWQTWYRIASERGCLRTLEGGCSVPVGVESFLMETDGGEGKQGKLTLTGTVTSVDGSKHVSFKLADQVVSSFEQAEQVGVKVAEGLIERGAGGILKEIEANKQASLASK
ncbi:Porphobilinogen deaminase [Phaffia rhodozyma]|uniref:Porphobilinogen deaminase n=1 Tax=Phaffia rhodozyma TaxID=264483 RepID=A0A0F7SGT8_PHARH|nr:Porphobilinogen deaminase [Phaffia rhodozyma]